MNTMIKKFLIVGAVTLGVAVPCNLYANQVKVSMTLEQEVLKQKQALTVQNQKYKNLEKEVRSQNRIIDTLLKKNKELEAKNDELEGVRSTIKQSVGYIPSREELDLLERLVECEAGCEPYSGKVAVANVVFNRIKSDKFPNSITDVIYQKNQFEPVVTGMIDNRTASEEVKKAVHEAIMGKQVVSSDILNFWANYLPAENELWKHIPVEFEIGTTCFGKEWIN